VRFKVRVEGLGPEDADRNGWYLEQQPPRVNGRPCYIHEKAAAFMEFVEREWVLMPDADRTADYRVTPYRESFGLESLARALAGATRVCSLRLRGSYSISPYSAALLGRSRTLTSLELMGGRTYDPHDGNVLKEVEMQLEEAMRFNTTLRRLAIRRRPLPACIEAHLSRNQWRALLLTAKLDADRCFGSLRSATFLKHLAAYLLPPASATYLHVLGTAGRGAL